jgi:zinc protease
VNLQQPIVGLTKPGKLPAVIDTTLPNGLRVLAARKPGLPMVQVRLRIDVARSKGWGDGLIEDIAGQTIVTGTESRSQLDIAEELRALGAVMSTNVDAEDMYLAGTTVSTELAKYLAILADVLEHATHPDDEIALAKGQAEQGLAIAASQPETRARYGLAERLFPGHPYGHKLPTPDLVAPITRAQIRKFQKTMVTPNAALIVLVGDMPPAKMVAAVDKALGGWTSSRRVGRTPVPAPVLPGPYRLIHHPGAVQTNMRFGGVGVGRAHPDFPALMLALVILGGGFTSRLNHNLREDKGYTYGAGAGLTHNMAATQITISADVQTAVTAPAFVETIYELGRMATLPVDDDELAAAKRYIAGSLALQVQTQAGLATYLTTLAVAGLDVSYLRDLPLAADKLTVDDIAAASATYLSPSALAPVLVGDADQVAASLARLGASEVIA